MMDFYNIQGKLEGKELGLYEDNHKLSKIYKVKSIRENDNNYILYTNSNPIFFTLRELRDLAIGSLTRTKETEQYWRMI